uniref:Uncharacterized protein LOC102808588 n=1 Tax=Saccoglossus kowalevskii TaxID=10224 RepID=A0ABM0LWI3_SACKO|nr:PREDICTED: uncharacterized protein LOC102808588 [Saccoglossus kowalevskii]
MWKLLQVPTIEKEDTSSNESSSRKTSLQLPKSPSGSKSPKSPGSRKPLASPRKTSTSRSAGSSRGSTPWKKIRGITLINKLKGAKKKDGTPEKATSPNLSQSQMEDDLPPSKQIINGEDIQALAIDPDKLREVHIPKPPSAERRRTPTKPVMVRKHKPKSEIEKPKLNELL